VAGRVLGNPLPARRLLEPARLEPHPPRPPNAQPLQKVPA
jgi:hypothetical protein